MKKNTFLLFTMLVGVLNHSFSQKLPVIDLFIVAGQSNAVGLAGDGNYYPDDLENLDSSIRLNQTLVRKRNPDTPFTTNGWTTMQIQDGYWNTSLEDPSKIIGHFGLEVTFSRNLVLNGYDPAIFKFGEGSSSIYVQWGAPGDGGNYDAMIEKLKFARRELLDQGYRVAYRGFIWIQGETDAQVTPETGNRPAVDNQPHLYYQRLTTLINDVRDFTNKPELPVILGVDEQHPNILENPIVHTAHQKIAQEDPNIKFTSMVGFLKADKTHLAPQGLLDHGNLVFDNFQLLTNKTNTASLNEVNNSPTIIEAEGTSTSSATVSWGQSFKPNHFGKLSSFTFYSASTVNTSFTLTVYNGPNCEGVINNEGIVEDTAMYSQTLGSVVEGENKVIFAEDLILDREHTYYISITSDSGEEWKVQYSNQNQIYGCLRGSLSARPSSCGRDYLDFDMAFKVEIIPDGTNEVLELNMESSNETSVYPNPSNSFVTINLNGLTNSSVRIVSMNGVTVYSMDNINTTSHQVDVNGFESGLYTVHIISQHTQELHSLMIQ